MYQKYKELFKEYRLLVDEIDVLVSQLTSMHTDYLQCKKRCDLCCMIITFFLLNIIQSIKI